MLLITGSNYLRNAFTYYPLPYMELLPEYDCYNSQTLQTYSCTPDEFCGKDYITPTINYNADTSLNNWVEQLDLACKSDTMVGLIGSSFFAGVILGMFTITRISDVYGRKWPIIACSLLQVPLNIWLFYMTTLEEAYIIFFFFGLGFVGNVSIDSLYLQEFLQKRHRSIALTVIQTLEGFVVILCVIYFVYITKDW